MDSIESIGMVFLAHEMALRVEVSGAGYRYLKLVFYPRDKPTEEKPRGHDIHPTIHQALEGFKKISLE